MIQYDTVLNDTMHVRVRWDEAQFYFVFGASFPSVQMLNCTSSRGQCQLFWHASLFVAISWCDYDLKLERTSEVLNKKGEGQAPQNFNFF